MHPDIWARASAAEDLAVLLGGTGQERAIKSLKFALERYDQIGAERDSARVRRRLRKLGFRRRHWATVPARPVSGWASLTGTEQTIAGLVAEGLNTNRSPLKFSSALIRSPTICAKHFGSSTSRHAWNLLASS